jgi:hypothetical protein
MSQLCQAAVEVPPKRGVLDSITSNKNKNAPFEFFKYYGVRFGKTAIRPFGDFLLHSTEGKKL